MIAMNFLILLSFHPKLFVEQHHNFFSKAKTYIQTVLVCVSTLVLCNITCVAQTYPSKPVRVIVPFAPGGGGDITARMVSSKLAERFKQQFVVDNRGGAGGLVGVELAVKAAPDGYTILIASSSFSATSATHKPIFDPVNNIAPIGEIGIAPFVLSVHPSVPVKNARELIALVRSKPDAMIYAIPGIGSITHLATELMLHTAGIRMTGIPYKGTGPAMIEVISGQCQLILGSLPPLAPHFATGKLRPLAVTSAKRWYSVPDLATLNETLPGYAVENWWGMMAPKGTPPSIVDRLNSILNQVLQDDSMKTSMAKEGVIPSGGTAKQFGTRTREEYGKWLEVVARANIRPQPE
jgi:tripartite-type tricarboxylate transporter receptor subunit TctC